MAIGHTPGSKPASGGDRLDSWKEIASYLKRSVRTVTRWERYEGLPVHRHLHSKTGTVYAYKSELDTWWTTRGKQLVTVAASPATRQSSLFPRAWRAAFVAAAILIAAVAWFASRSSAPTRVANLVPLTTYSGIEGPPSLSPDGNQVAFERNGDVYVKQVDSEALVQLTRSPIPEDAPAWSPDGREIAFVRAGMGVFVVSPLGGGERKVADTLVPPVLKSVAWTPDSKSLIVSEMTSPICASLFLVSVVTGEKKRLTWPPEPSIGDGWPAVSPDGLTLAFARYPQDSSANIYLVPLAGGAPRQLTTEKGSLFGLTWTPDGKQLVFSSDRAGISRLWQVPIDGSFPSSPSPLETAGEDARFPSFSRARERSVARLAYQRFDQNVDIRRAEIIAEATPAHTLRPSADFIASTRSDDHPQFSPNGKQIAFVSNRSGTFEIWVCDSDGSNLVRLTSMDGPIVAAPRWSPDNQRIAFFSATGSSGNYLGYVINAKGGSPARMSHDDVHVEALPSWSHDGRWIYFTSGTSGSLQIWKIPSNGGVPIRLTQGGGAEPSESPDGRLLYYTQVPELGAGLWSVPTEGGTEIRVLDSVRFGYWTVTAKGIYYIDFDNPKDAPPRVMFFNFWTRRAAEVGRLEKTVRWETTPGFSVSPDGRWLLYSNLASTDADLMLVDNFR